MGSVHLKGRGNISEENGVAHFQDRFLKADSVPIKKISLFMKK